MLGEKFKGKYRIASARHPLHDYSSAGAYFVTICVRNMECLLGEIKNGIMILSDFGNIVEKQWYESFKIRHELHSDEFVIMPNHLHAIIILNKPETCKMNDPQDLCIVEMHGRASLRYETHANQKYASNPSQQNENKLPFVRKPKSISSFVAGFKSAVNSKIDHFIDDNHLNIPKFDRKNHFFQPNYYDHIIRNVDEYYCIKNYIKNNPINWHNDDFINKRQLK